MTDLFQGSTNMSNLEEDLYMSDHSSEIIPDPDTANHSTSTVDYTDTEDRQHLQVLQDTKIPMDNDPTDSDKSDNDNHSNFENEYEYSYRSPRYTVRRVTTTTDTCYIQ